MTPLRDGSEQQRLHGLTCTLGLISLGENGRSAGKGMLVIFLLYWEAQ